MRMTRWAAAAIAVATASTATGAWAQSDNYWARRSKAMVEHSHQVTLSLADGYAKMVVRRTVDNQGERNDEASFDVFIPDGAVAVGLRTLALKDGAPHWYRGDLMEAEAAAQKYLELTGIGGAYPKDPALLSWRSMGHLRLQVFPCPPKAKKSVEYTLLLPTDYRGGEHVVTLPRFGTAQIEPDIRLAAAPGKLRVDGKRARVGQRLVLGDDDEVDVALSLRRMPTLGGKLAAVPAGKQALNRVRIEAAPKLSTVPRGARVVIAIDVSRSWEDSDVEASRRAALAYLSHMPDARVEVITFARHTKRHHGHFVSAKNAIKELKTANLARKNGSFVDEALSLADTLLLKGKGPARIVLFTDTRTRIGLDAPQLRAVLGGHALVHIVDPMIGSESGLLRDDDHTWAEIAKSTGGLFWTAGVEPGTANQRVFEELVRPVRVHNFAMAASGISVDECERPATLDEGEGVTCSQVGSKPASWVSATGQLWNKPIRLRIEPDKQESDRWAALAFGHGDHGELTEEEMMGVALRGKAVSPVTSYLAIEPGVRPSRDGLAHGQLGGRRGRAPSVRMGMTGVSGTKPVFDGEAYLTNAFATAWLKCGGAGKKASVRLETNLREIIDVYDVSSDKGTDKQISCLMEGVWAEPLPVPFDGNSETWDISI
jgi:hypothetical protein